MVFVSSKDGELYESFFDRTECTVGRFIMGIFEHKPNTYGYIGIKDSDGIYNDLIYSYRFGKLETAPTEYILDERVKKAKWQNCGDKKVDYLLTI